MAWPIYQCCSPVVTQPVVPASSSSPPPRIGGERDPEDLPFVGERGRSVRRLTGWVSRAKSGDPLSLSICACVCTCVQSRKGTPSEVGMRERVKRYCFGRE